MKRIFDAKIRSVGGESLGITIPKEMIEQTGLKVGDLVTVTIEKNGVLITVRGDQRIINVEIDGVMENRVAEAINDAVKKTQELAARKLMEMNQE